MNCLIIDDSEEIIDVVSLCFELLWPEASVMAATDGEGGLKLAKQHFPDLMLLDNRIGDSDGLEVLRSFRAFSEAPVVVLSAWDDQAQRTRFLAEGADDYVAKPFDHYQLIDRLREVLNRAR